MKTTKACSLALTAVLWAGVSDADDPRSGSMLGNPCAGCHGTRGASAGHAMPVIGGLGKRYLVKTMTDFRDGTRPGTIMNRIARGYTDLEIQAMAAFFAGQDWARADVRTDAGLARTGGRIHQEQCASCHGDEGRTNAQGTPRLAGQWPGYLEDVLGDLRDVDYPGPQPLEMRERVQALSDAEIRALSHYYASRR
ncbi:MAG: c-type cytochrome [Chromatiales bacterium]|jgi:sulfide dehydrogenase cytochrome subunit